MRQSGVHSSTWPVLPVTCRRRTSLGSNPWVAGHSLRPPGPGLPAEPGGCLAFLFCSLRSSLLSILPTLPGPRQSAVWTSLAVHSARGRPFLHGSNGIRITMPGGQLERESQRHDIKLRTASGAGEPGAAAVREEGCRQALGSGKQCVCQ